MTFDGVVFTLTMLFFYGGIALVVLADRFARQAAADLKAANRALEDARQCYTDTASTLSESEFRMIRVLKGGKP